MREKEVKAKAKEEEKAKKAAESSSTKVVEDLDPTKYTENRRQWIQEQRDGGKNPYPHKFSRTHRIDAFRAEYKDKVIENGKFIEEEKVSVTGRIIGIRGAGAKLIFIDLEGDSEKI